MSRQSERTEITEDELEFIQAVGRINNTPSSSNTLDKINSARRRTGKLPLSRNYFDKVLHAGGCRDLKTVFGFKVDKFKKNINDSEDTTKINTEPIKVEQPQATESNDISNIEPVTTEKVEVKMEPVIKNSQLTNLGDPDVITILKYISEVSTDIRINTIKDKFHWGYPRLMKVYKILENEGIITIPQKKREERKVNVDTSFIKDIIKDVIANKEEIETIKIKNAKLDYIKNVYTSFIYILDGLGTDKITSENLKFKHRNLTDDRFNLVVLQAIHSGVIKHQDGGYIIEPCVLRQEMETPYGHRWIPEKYQYLINVDKEDFEDKESIDSILPEEDKKEVEDKKIVDTPPEEEVEDKKIVDTPPKDEAIIKEPKAEEKKPKKEDKQDATANKDVVIKINGIQIVLHNETNLVSPTVQFENDAIKIIF